MQPELTDSAFKNALRKFDAELRDTNEWTGWQENRAHLYPIRHDGRLYPVKQIASMASGIPVGDFSGGRYPGHANQIVERLGYEVVRLRETNPDWSRDELIVALDFYLRHRPNPPGKDSPEIAQLSKTLRNLGERLFPKWERSGTYRNENGVNMKLMSFRRLDPQYIADGKVGLSRGSQGEVDVWGEFASDPARCHAVAVAIVSALKQPDEALTEEETEAGMEEAPEGRLLTRQHIARERSRKLVEAKRKQALTRDGSLSCEACGFDFKRTYGERGTGFMECHHTRPVSQLTEGQKTRLNELALLCANCHRILHRSRPWLSVDELRTLLGR
jgi:5-methylcytosine-specific restriction protein A